MDYIPFIKSDNNYVLNVAIGGARYLFVTYWNSVARAWYFDLRDDSGTPIAVGIKVVLGVNLGRRSSHPFFRSHSLRAVDTANPSNAGVDAGFDDLGARIQVIHVAFSNLLPGTTGN